LKNVTKTARVYTITGPVNAIHIKYIVEFYLDRWGGQCFYLFYEQNIYFAAGQESEQKQKQHYVYNINICLTIKNENKYDR